MAMKCAACCRTEYHYCAHYANAHAPTQCLRSIHYPEHQASSTYII